MEFVKKLPVYEPSLTGNEKKYVMDCLDTSWISSKGEYINKFESGLAEYLSVKHATAVCNGTVALHLALIALGIGQGDEVIVPTLTYIASVNAIAYTGATPIFVDSLADSWQMDPADFRRKITANTKAVMCVHLYGHPCDMDSILPIAREHDLFVIEDCAESLGSLYKGKHTGTFGDIATFSFYGNKTITTGEGGMVVTNDETLHDRCVHFKGQGLAKHRQYWHDVIGYNYRMTNICAAIGLAQLEQIDTFLSKKQQIASWYREGLNGSSLTLHEPVGDIYHAYWMCSVLVHEAKDRDVLRNHLEKKGIETRPLFYPVHTMPMYSQKFARFKVAENLGWRGMNLPSYPGLTYEDVTYIVDSLLSFYANAPISTYK
ncbi:DegT/DnrJ/EryC1/StrS aminotransferase family protein [Fibrella sp. HMF5335]|uniref:GDP-perosamine synthase n=1 Tax=Fibrella rubiginis TaxID=2817060 RepID=A0A939GF17_9BACT|nr:DegT/DnrJ/EryC1/StrS aminotransferase family protein [Fibrella rubiginis]MBO0937947.1 DegT/DnrJ/EryC1/StrS aminotransferase family protein [Fibrella rubiginis]